MNRPRPWSRMHPLVNCQGNNGVENGSEWYMEGGCYGIQAEHTGVVIQTE